MCFFDSAFSVSFVVLYLCDSVSCFFAGYFFSVVIDYVSVINLLFSVFVYCLFCVGVYLLLEI